MIVTRSMLVCWCGWLVYIPKANDNIRFLGSFSNQMILTCRAGAKTHKVTCKIDTQTYTYYNTTTKYYSGMYVGEQMLTELGILF